VSYQQSRPSLLRVFSRDPDRHVPVDEEYVQSKWVRIYRPGPWRTVGFIVMVFLTSWLAIMTILATAIPQTILTKLVGFVLLGVPLFVCGWLTIRMAESGVYVTDRQVRVISLTGVTVVPWQDVADVRRTPGRQALLGVALFYRDGERVALVLRNGDGLQTPLTSHSPDFTGRAEAYDMAALRLERWWEESRT
jgi:hypothetical protein